MTSSPNNRNWTGDDIGSTFDMGQSFSDAGSPSSRSATPTNDTADVETGTAVDNFNDYNITAKKTLQEQQQPTPTAIQYDRKSKQRIGMLVVGIVIVAVSMFFIGMSVGSSNSSNNEVVSSSTQEETQDVSISAAADPIIPDEELVVPDIESAVEELPLYVLNLTSSDSPSDSPTSSPISAIPSQSPITSSPTQSPTLSPEPTSSPTPKNPYFFGTEFITVPELGIEMSTGLKVKLIAKTGEKVQYGNGANSTLEWHTRSDAAGIISLDDGGYVYMSNSEEYAEDGGGVYGLYFNSEGEIVEYKALLTGTDDNCGGGLTPWNTWVSCEEESDVGQCWQVDPYGRAEETVLGGEGGNFESVAVDDRIYDAPVFFTTEDSEDGALRRFIASQHGWDALHTEGEHSFLNLFDDGTYEWTTDEKDARKSAKEYFPNSEGIQVHEGKVYFMSKELQHLIILDLENMTWTSEESGVKFYGEGSFGGQPDQNMFGPTRKYIYFTEDGSSDPGVYARYGDDGTYFTMFQAIEDDIHTDDETIGIALSPDGKRFYAGFQVTGYIFEFTREDGLAFE